MRTRSASEENRAPARAARRAKPYDVTQRAGTTAATVPEITLHAMQNTHGRVSLAEFERRCGVSFAEHIENTETWANTFLIPDPGVWDASELVATWPARTDVHPCRCCDEPVSFVAVGPTNRPPRYSMLATAVIFFCPMGHARWASRLGVEAKMESQSTQFCTVRAYVEGVLDRSRRMFPPRPGGPPEGAPDDYVMLDIVDEVEARAFVTKLCSPTGGGIMHVPIPPNERRWLDALDIDEMPYVAPEAKLDQERIRRRDATVTGGRMILIAR